MNTPAMGALTFKPPRGPIRRQPTAIKLAQIVEQARRAVHGITDDDDHISYPCRIARHRSDVPKAFRSGTTHSKTLIKD